MSAFTEAMDMSGADRLLGFDTEMKAVALDVAKELYCDIRDEESEDLRGVEPSPQFKRDMRAKRRKLAAA